MGASARPFVSSLTGKIRGYFIALARPYFRMNADSEAGRGFDAFVERELRLRVGVLTGPRPEVHQAAYRAVVGIGGNRMPLLSSLTATASTKAAVGLATAALVVGGGSAAAAAASGSANPSDWGKTVTQAVATCKSDLSAGQHGIGPCVSKTASQKGQAERAAHAASSAREIEPRSTPSSHPTAHSGPATAPTSHPTGKPTDVPAGTPPSAPPAGGGSHPTPSPRNS